MPVTLVPPSYNPADDCGPSFGEADSTSAVNPPCASCGRKITSSTRYFVGGKWYGPGCFERLGLPTSSVSKPKALDEGQDNIFDHNPY